MQLLAIRSRSSSTASRCPAAARAYSRATAACSAKAWSGWTSASRKGGPSRPLAIVSEPMTRLRPARGTNRAGPTPARTTGWTTRPSAAASATVIVLPVRITSPVTEPSTGNTLPCSRAAPSPSAASMASRSLSAGRARVARSASSSPWPPHHQGEQLARLRAGQDRDGDGPDGLQPPGPVVRLLVQVGVADGRAGLGGEQDQSPLVVGVEVPAVRLLGQVEVAVDLAAGHDRDAQERPHRRVVGREADRGAVVGQVAQAQRAGVLDQHAEDAAADRDVADRRPLLVADAGGDELGDGAVPAEDAQRPVAGAGELGGQLDDALQDDRELQVGGEGQPASNRRSPSWIPAIAAAYTAAPRRTWRWPVLR